MRPLICSILIIAGCSVPVAPRDDQADIVREALAFHIREFEAIQRRASGLPGIAFIGTASPQGREPIGDVDAGLLSSLRSDIFKIRQTSGSEIRNLGPGPNFITDKATKERGIRMLASPPKLALESASISIFSAMSSWDGIGGEFRLTLKREAGPWKVKRSERLGPMH